MTIYRVAHSKMTIFPNGCCDRGKMTNYYIFQFTLMGVNCHFALNRQDLTLFVLCECEPDMHTKLENSNINDLNW